MALRPTELQIILSATRDIEKAQQIQQHQPRSQQDNLALQFQQEIEHRKRQTQSAGKAEQGDVKKVSSDERQAGNRRQKNTRNPSQPAEGDDETRNTKGDHIIDFLI